MPANGWDAVTAVTGAAPEPAGGSTQAGVPLAPVHEDIEAPAESGSIRDTEVHDDDGSPLLFRGLRVRMGIATGVATAAQKNKAGVRTAVLKYPPVAPLH